MISDDALTYITHLFAQEGRLLQDARSRAAQNDFSINVTRDVGKVLRLLVTLTQAQRVVEIGTHAGCSTAWLAEALPPGGHIFTIERSPDRLPLARETIAQLPNREQVTLYEGWAQDVLPTLDAAMPCDFIFVDADKRHYLDYLNWAAEHLRPGGLFIADDVFLKGAVFDDREVARVRPSTRQRMRDFNETVAQSSAFDATILPTPNGLLVAVKER